MSLSACQLREMVRGMGLPPSFLFVETGTDIARCRDFLGGNDDALTAEQLSEIERILDPDEPTKFKNLTTNRETFHAVAYKLQRHAVAFLFEDPKLKLASGTLVRIGDSIFVATAGHVVRPTRVLQFVGENTASFEVDDLDSRNPTYSGAANVGVLNSGKHGTHDVGFFELEQSACDTLGREALELNQIAIQTGQFGRSVFILGYPSQLVTEHGRSDRIEIGSITYRETLLAPDEWPDVPENDTRPDECVDCFIRYPVGDEMTVWRPPVKSPCAPQIDFPDNLPDAPGLSGGGFWQSGTPKDRVFDPSSYKLIAIQSAWSREREYLRAIQARHWLDLVRTKCPNLHGPIDDHIARSAH